MSAYIPPPASLPPGSLAWAYLRDSGGESQEQSVGQQEAVICEYCELNGLVLVKVFKDIARSGGSVAGRDAFNELINASKEAAQRPAGLLLWNFARFSRDLDDSSFYKASLRKLGIVVHSITDPIPAGRYGRVIETLIDISNEEKRRQTSEDVKRALAANVKAGYSPGGTPPRGYRPEAVVIGEKRNGVKRVVSKWIPDPELWDLVKLSWSMRAQGKGYAAITEATGGKLYTSKNSWAAFFSNKTYLGIGKCGDLEIPDHHEAAITWETWEAVQLIHRSAPRYGKSGQMTHPRRMSNPSLLSGFAFCIHCGSAMVLHRDRDFVSYACGKRDRQRGSKTCPARRVNANKVNLLILDRVLNQILTPTFIEDLLGEIQTNLRDTDKLDRDLDQNENMLMMTERSIHRLITALEHTGNIQEIVERLKQLKGEAENIKVKIQAFRKERAVPEYDLSPEAMEILLQSWRCKIEQTSAEGDVLSTKRMMSYFVQKVELGHNQAKIFYTFPDFNPADNVNGLWGHHMDYMEFSFHVVFLFF
jgi:site-specific DNA recombinase